MRLSLHIHPGYDKQLAGWTAKDQAMDGRKPTNTQQLPIEITTNNNVQTGVNWNNKDLCEITKLKKATFKKKPLCSFRLPWELKQGSTERESSTLPPDQSAN